MKRNPMYGLSTKMKTFIRLVVDGVPEMEACIKAYPPHKLLNSDVQLATLMDNPKIQNAIHFLTKHKSNPDILASSLAKILNDPKSKPAQKLTAIKMLGQLGGHIKNEIDPEIAKRKNTPKLKPGQMHDDAFQSKIAELKKKAEGRSKIN